MMVVYVDDYRQRAQVRRLTATWSHLLADTSEELVGFASRLGLQRRWIQKPGTVHEHFDVTDGMRGRALRMGAVGITYRQAGLFVARKRAALQPAPAVVQGTLEAAEPAGPPPGRKLARWNPETARHAWLKLREHWYRCAHCDLVAENALTGVGWVKWWHWPGGDISADVTTPKCPGPVDEGPS